MTASSRIQHPGLRERLMTAEAAAELVPAGANVGMSGFTGAGYPKAVPQALAERIARLNAQGQGFRIGLWTGASTAPELDGALAKVNGVELRMPYQSDPQGRARINAGEMEYTDIHLSHVAQYVWFGFFGKLDVAVIEVAGEPVPVVLLGVGNPQCIVLGPLPDEARFRAIGGALAVHPVFPEGTNVEFVEVEGPSAIRVRVWERGAGPTLACGTGACATLVSCPLLGLSERRAHLRLPGGDLFIDWRDDDHVAMTGPVEFEFETRLTSRLFEGVDA